LWRAAFGQPANQDPAPDLNRSGHIDAADYVLWRNALAGAASSAAFTGTEINADVSTLHRIHGADKANAADATPKFRNGTLRRLDPAFIPAVFDQALTDWPATSSNSRVLRFKQLALAAANARPLDGGLLLNIAAIRLHPAVSLNQPLDHQDDRLHAERRGGSEQAADDFFTEVGLHPNELSAECAALHE
jgi:hypothetical protein